MRSPTLKSGAQKGFTLIELLIVIGIIGFLAAAVLVAVDPVKRIQDARDSRRFAEANAILNAMLNKQVDDRRLYTGAADAPIITHATFSQVLVTSTLGIECDTDLTEAYPGCNQQLDVGATPASSKSCVVNISETETLNGTGTTTGTALAGTNTLFNTQVIVGDVITFSNGATCTVQTVTSDTAIVCSNTPAPAATGATMSVPTGATNPFIPNYIASAPVDPRGTGATICGPGDGCTTPAVGITTLGATNTGYYVHRTSGNRLEVGACSGEQTTAINVKR